MCVLVGEIHESQSHLSATQLTVADFLASRKPPHSTPQYSPHGFVTALWFTTWFIIMIYFSLQFLNSFYFNWKNFVCIDTHTKKKKMKHKVSDWNGVNFGGEVLSGVVWCKWDVGGRGVECQRPLVEKRGQWESRLSYVHERNQLDTERERTAAERGFWPRDSRTAPLSLSTVPTRDGILQIHNGTLSSSTSVTSLHHIFFFLKGLFCLLRGGNFKFEKNKRFGQFFEKETLCRFAGNTLLFCLREREERERAEGGGRDKGHGP